MKLILATGNKGKVREFREILEPLGYEILSQGELGLDLNVEETGETFEENAFLKADAVLKATGHAAVADDSGLCVEALGGAPGGRGYFSLPDQAGRSWRHSPPGRTPDRSRTRHPRRGPAISARGTPPGPLSFPHPGTGTRYSSRTSPAGR